MAEENLETKILAYDFAGLGQKGFAKLLANEAKIAVPLAQKVTREYLRFVYLTQIAPSALTPSKIVDAAWHVHLTRTRDYWEVFCHEVLGKPLHHDAATGAQADKRHASQYAKTRVLYQATFGEAPPDHLWPNAPQKQAGRSANVVLMILGIGIVAFCLVQPDMPLAGPLAFLGVIIAAIGFFRGRSNPRRTGKNHSHAGCSAGCAGGYTAGSAGFWSSSNDSFGGGGSDGGGASCGGGGD
ncbi:MAG: glycine-rich domain-containing protein [Maritimibacter sp.]